VDAATWSDVQKVAESYTEYPLPLVSGNRPADPRGRAASLDVIVSDPHPRVYDHQ
jgi:hypothetical protein